MVVVKVYRKGIVVLPKSIRERAGIREGMLLSVSVTDEGVLLRPLDLWERVWGCAKGLGSVEDFEEELDREEELWLRRRLSGRS